MSEYRNRLTGEVKTQGEIRRLMFNTSLPRVWTASVCDGLNIDPVLAAPAPIATGYTQAVRNGVVLDDNNNWVTGWSVVDMFADYVDKEGVTVTKASQEEACTATKAADAAIAVRTTRDGLIASCDWMAIKAFEAGSIVSTDWATYRQALRDVTEQTEFPHNVTWPTQPE
jgi:hypothetical protein